MTRAIPHRLPSDDRSKSRSAHDHLVVRALRTMQADGVAVYTFFLPGADLLRVAEISRIHRDTDQGELRGFQRREIRDHVRSITAFLDSANSVLFPIPLDHECHIVPRSREPA